jgi:hypothetical protein
MASVPNAAKPGLGAGGVLILLLVIALALGAHHLHMATSAGSGGGHALPHLVGTASDPCQDKPDNEVIRTVHAPRRSTLGQVTLDCREWRAMLRRMLTRGTGGRATITQILACVEATVQRGDWAEKDSIDHYAWHWGAGMDDFALVVADATGRIAFATPGPAHLAWRQCAKAAG